MAKTFKFSKSFIIYISIFLLAVNLLLGIVLTQKAVNAITAQMRGRMLDIANTAAALLNGDELAALQKEDKNTEPYRRAASILRKFYDQIDMEYIYGIRDMGDGTFTFTIDPEPVAPGGGLRLSGCRNESPASEVDNRNAYVDKLKAVNEDIKEKHINFSIAIFDINGLKITNDELGHECGDLMIMATGQILKDVFALDSIFRIGGDEFVVIIENTDGHTIEKKFQAFSEKVQNKKIKRNDKDIPLAISKGISSFRAGEDRVAKDVFRRADNAMYEDKAAYYAGHADRRKKR